MNGTAMDLWAVTYLHQEGTQQHQPKNANQLHSGQSKEVEGYEMITYSTGTCSNNPNPERIKSSINIVPNHSRADSDHILLSVVLDFGEILQADMDTSGRRESGVCLMATTLDLLSIDPEHRISEAIIRTDVSSCAHGKWCFCHGQCLELPESDLKRLL